jgi:hypothetical protein
LPGLDVEEVRIRYPGAEITLPALDLEGGIAEAVIDNELFGGCPQTLFHETSGYLHEVIVCSSAASIGQQLLSLLALDSTAGPFQDPQRSIMDLFHVLLRKHFELHRRAPDLRMSTSPSGRRWLPRVTAVLSDPGLAILAGFTPQQP